MLKETLDDFFKHYSLIKKQSVYAVAVSGGSDSMALAHALVTHYPDKIFHLLSVDHGLRVESKNETQKVAAYFSPYKNAIHTILEWQGDKPDTAIMEAARKARYDLMIEYCQQHHIDTLFIGHHQDDQAETFLTRLSKGSGLDGLIGMKSLTQRDEIALARPFLFISKQDMIAYCQQNKVAYCEDPTNQNVDYLRPRLRQSREILEKEGLSSKRLAFTAKRLARAKDALDFYTQELINNSLIENQNQKIILDFNTLKNAPDEISLRAIQNLLETTRQGYDYKVRMEKLEDLHHCLISDSDNFKPRTLGGCLFSLIEKQTKLVIEKEGQ